MEQEETVFISDREVSRLTGIGRQTLCNWRCQQKGPRYVKVGRAVRYALHDVLAYMEARKIGTEDQPKDPSCEHQEVKGKIMAQRRKTVPVFNIRCSGLVESGGDAGGD